MPSTHRPTVKKPTIGPTELLSVAEALRGTSWLAPLGEVAVERLAPHARLRRVAQGELVLRQGVPVRHLVLVIEGWLEVGVTSHGGRRLVLDQLPAGSTCGLAAMIDARASLQDARAGVDGLVLLLPRAVAMVATQELPGFADAMLRLLAGRVRAVVSAYVNRSLITLQPRVASLLIRLARGLGPAPLLQVSQEDLAAMLGVSRQALSPVLKQLERDGLIALGYRKMQLLDPAQLRLLLPR